MSQAGPSSPGMPPADSPPAPAVVSGVQLMKGIGVSQSRGFWTEALLQMIRRPGAIFGLAWLAIVLLMAIIAPFIANGHPLTLTWLDGTGRITHPFLDYLKPTDLLLPAWAVLVAFWCVVPEIKAEKARARLGRLCAGVASALALTMAALLLAGSAGARAAEWFLPAFGIVSWSILAALARSVRRSERFGTLFVAAIATGLMVVMAEYIIGAASAREASASLRALKSRPAFPLEASAVLAAVVTAAALAMGFIGSFQRRVAVFVPVGVLAAACLAATWTRPLMIFDDRDREARGEVHALYTLIPWSPTQRRTELNTRPPGSSSLASEIDRLTAGLPADGPLTREQLQGVTDGLTTIETIPAEARAALAESFSARTASGSAPDRTRARAILNAASGPHFVLGTDSLGQDVLSQVIHACRLSISIGLVSTGISVLIGVTLGSLMGYFGGLVDVVLSRVLEVFQAIPVLFLLIVAAAVLPRNTYVMMIIIGCVTWTGAARFIRAEFYKLRGQDFVQSARALGLPLRSILFRHMLPNGVTPVLVDASFAVAAAILAEATLSYLGLGPEGQPSWGQLLSDATGSTGDFVWWLAIFPGAAIFITVLSYNLIGEALRDAIDPKLKKARV